MPTKRQARSAKRLRNLTKQRGKYPELLVKVIEISDIILEILDARFAKEMQNQEIENLIQSKNKKIIYVLNKADLIEKKERIFPHQIFVSCKNRKGISELRKKIKIESAKLRKTGDYERIHVGVIGYPNTGKSSLINLLIGRNSAKTGAEAGFTKSIQKLRLTENIHLLDSPGIIPSEKYSMTGEDKIAQHAKFGGRSYNQVRNPEFVVNELVKDNRKALENFYKIEFSDAEDLMEKLGKKKSFLKKGGEIDTDRTARAILKNWQLGEIRV